MLQIFEFEHKWWKGTNREDFMLRELREKA
jgi:hypothetical protein